MFASIEKKLIEKNYKENLLNGYLFAYQNKKDQLKNIELFYDTNTNKYIFSFPLYNSKNNYTIHFNYFQDLKQYMNYIVVNYI
jgi:hypothetical protein|tara:strand:- start:7006 stop:7254 length:249 start_codon:yes stop_codon:yes gene_type:complete